MKDDIINTRGRTGIAFIHLTRDEADDIEGRTLFRAASVMKAPILLELLWQAQEKALSLDERYSLKPEDVAGGSGVLQELHSGIELTFLDMARLMSVVSDNTASNILLDRVGMNRVNERLAALGLEETRLRRRFMDFEAAAAGLENTTTPIETARLFERLYRQEGVPEPVCRTALDILSRQQDKEKLARYLPEGIEMAHKTGELTGAAHDAGIIYSSSGPYVLTVFCEGIPDRASGQEKIGRISEAIYQHCMSSDMTRRA
ncbi:MAG: serine hydrolase [Armatimonadetes bacterium]|nr:serine hydrolase [Armatimonadota bacterium]